MWSDEELLVALYMRDRMGRTSKQIGAALGKSKGSVAGAMHRIDLALAKTDNGLQNGTMPSLWWKMRAKAAA